ncbi:MAG: type II toxin-antitoxin system RelE/ParE family toxin [Bacteroidales bacterium]|nr:type II toxin-antitoxin system RelE/ParE family toxin [Bacteroidales bacterium]
MYKVVFSKSARKDLCRVDSTCLSAIDSNIRKLAQEPRPHGYRKLLGAENTYRVRVGVYRIIYTIKDEILTVEVIKIGHRCNVYK